MQINDPCKIQDFGTSKKFMLLKKVQMQNLLHNLIHSLLLVDAHSHCQ